MLFPVDATHASRAVKHYTQPFMRRTTRTVRRYHADTYYYN
jgi:hypothetical protein